MYNTPVHTVYTEHILLLREAIERERVRMIIITPCTYIQLFPYEPHKSRGRT